MSFFAMEQGSKTIAFEASTLDEIIKIVGPRAESSGKSYVIFGQAGIVEPIKTFNFKSVEEIKAEVAAVAAAAAAAAAVAAAEKEAAEKTADTAATPTAE